MRILISGASGFIGAPLFKFLKGKGHSVVPLVRRKSNTTPEILWDPYIGPLSNEDFEGFDAVIHLGGEPLTIGRWSSKKKRAIHDSRTIPTSILSQHLATLTHPPKIFISASAVGYYGNRGDEFLTEKSPPGNGFLAGVCSEWEKASEAVEKRGTRTLRTRFGMVIGPKGGALNKMILPFQLGLGGKLGTGEQWVSWIHLEDLISAFNHLLETESLEGAVNFVTPNPVQQKEFASILAKILNRPSFFNIPAPLLRLILGETADELLLSSARIEPTKLVESGFKFNYPCLESAIKLAV